MNKNQKQQLQSAYKILQMLTEEMDQSEKSLPYMTTNISGDGILVLEANANGCIYLASLLLSMADKGIDNQHYHLDNTSLTDCEKPLVLKFKQASWEF